MKSDRDERRAAAMTILGKLVCFAHQPEGPPYLCVLMDTEGMVEILGMTGRFAPHLFIPFAGRIADHLKGRIA